MEISQNFVAFFEYINFTKMIANWEIQDWMWNTHNIWIDNVFLELFFEIR